MAAQVVFRRIDNQTLEEIGQSLGLTRERIRQIEKTTLQQINQLSEIDHFKILLHSRQAHIEHQLLGKHGCTTMTGPAKKLQTNPTGFLVDQMPLRLTSEVRR